MRVLTSIAVLQIVIFSATTGLKAEEDDYGIGNLNYLIENNPDLFCHYIECEENVTPENCPNKTMYMEGVAQFGCCGACVQFRESGDSCTGSIDPLYGGGYNVLSKKAALRATLSTAGPNGAVLPPNDNTLYSSWCDYYLKCYEGSPSSCDVGSTVKGCKMVQDAYDNATASPEPHPADNPTSADFILVRDDYRWRPVCKHNGEYAEKQCKGPLNEERCVCVTPDGARLFGAAFSFQKELYDNMNCKCSRKVWEKKQAGASAVTLHCAENGNYEPLQCEDGWCYCMDPNTATPYGPNMPENAMNHLPCYNETTIGQQYLRRCESEYYAHAVLSDKLMEKGVLPPSTALNCDEDGSYGAIQWDGTMSRCYDKYMNSIHAPAGDGCQCYRDDDMFKRLSVDIQLTCDINSGRYAQKQYREGTVYCNDEDGVRSGPLVYKDYDKHLGCLEAMSCQNGVKSNCPFVCNDCPIEAYVKYVEEP